MFDDFTHISQSTTTACADEPQTVNNPCQQDSNNVIEETFQPGPTDKAAECPPVKTTSITRRCRLLCPDGCGLQRVKSIERLPLPWTVVTLACGHVRGEILPAKGISLEHVGSPEGLRLFPPDLIAEHIWGKSRKSRYC